MFLIVVSQRMLMKAFCIYKFIIITVNIINIVIVNHVNKKWSRSALSLRTWLY